MTPRMRTPSARKGFTLIELLVVIAILAVLIGLLFPILNSMQRGARSAECVSNLRQLGTAAIQYSNDNDGALLPSGQEGGSSYTWNILLQRYLVGYHFTIYTRTPLSKVSYCPAFYTDDPRGRSKKPSDRYVWGWSTGYIINDYPGYGEGGEMNQANRIRMNNKGERTDLYPNGWTADFRMDRLTHKSVRPWIMDGSEWQTGVNPAKSVAGSKYGGVDFNRHGKDRSNVLFFDLHVESAVSEKTIRTGLKTPVELDKTSVL